MKFFYLPLFWLLLPATYCGAQKNELLYAASWYEARSTFGDRYDLFYPLTETLAKVCTAGRCGLVDRSGREVLPLNYEIPDHFFGALLVIQKESKSGGVNARREPVIPVEYAELMPHFLSKSLVGVRKDSLWAVFDTAGRQITPFLFTNIESLVEDRIVASTTDRAYFGAWDLKGRNIIPERYHQLIPLPGGYWQARRFGKCALLGPNGIERTPFRYEEMLGMTDGTYFASSYRQDQAMYRYSKEGRQLSDSLYQVLAIGVFTQIIPPQGNTFLIDGAGKTKKMPGGEWISDPQPGDPGDWLRTSGGGEGEFVGWYDLKTGNYQTAVYNEAVVAGDHVIASDYTHTHLFDRSGHLLKKMPFKAFATAADVTWIVQSTEGMYGLCDTALQLLTELQEGTLERNVWGGFIRTSPEKVQVYDPHGKEIYTNLNLEGFSPDIRRNCAVFKSKGRYGVLRIDGKVLLPAQYEYTEAVGRHRFIVRQNGKSGFVDEYGHALLPLDFSLVAATPNPQWLRLQKDGKSGIASAATGKVLLPVEYDKLEGFGHFTIAQRNGKFGLYDKNLRVVLPERYDHLSWWNALWLISENGRWGVLNQNLETVLPVDYEQITFRQSPITAFRNGVVTRWVRIGTRLKPAGENLVYYWEDGMAVRMENGLHGLCDRMNVPILPVRYDQVMPVGQTGVMAVVREDNRAICISPEKKEVASFIADSLLTWQDEYLLFRRTGKRWMRNLLTGRETPVSGEGNLEILHHTPLVLIRTDKQVFLYDTNFDKGPVWQGESLHQHTSGAQTPPFFIGTKDGKLGLLSASANVVLPFEYDRISGSESYYSPYLWLEKDGKHGLFNCSNGRLLPPMFDHFEWVDNIGFITASSDGQNALFSPDYEQLTAFDLSETGAFGFDHFWAKRGEKVIILDRKGRALPAFLADELNIKPEGDGAFFRIGDMWGFLRPDGRIAIEPRYAGLNTLGKLAIQAYLPEGKSRIFTSNGQAVSAEAFDNVYAVLGERYFLVQKNGLNGIIDLNGRYTIPLQAEYLYCEGNACIVPKAGKQGLSRPDGTVLLPAEYDQIFGSEDAEGFFTVRRGNQFGFVNGEGRWLGKPEFDYARSFDAGLAAVRRNGKWGFIDTLGRVAIPFRYQYAENFRNYTKGAVVLYENTYQLIDKQGKTISGIPYGTGENLDDYFHSTPEPRRQAGKGQGLKYSEEDIWLLPPTGYRLWSPVYGIMVYGEDKDTECFKPPYGLMNFAGETLTPMIYGALLLDHFKVCDMIPAKLGTKWGFLNTKGEAVIPFEYDKAWNLFQPWENGEWRGGVHKNGRSWIIDRQGMKVRDE
ncbi:MAG: WG repeat-containing protein [Saprospiraceae bacterium]|nr:WG repeat-containing protein [Saprospiraceae bacterium]